MSFKIQQVLRTARSLRAESGTDVPAGTRVVVMSHPSRPGTSVKVKIQDPGMEDRWNERIVAGERFFDVTFRGRPRKEG